MLFTEFRFLPFFVATFLVCWAMRRNVSRKIWLLLVSYAFYAAWDWRFLSLIIGSTLVDWVAGNRIHRAQAKRTRDLWLAASVATNLGMLGFFKYWNFFIESGNELLQFMGLPSNVPMLSIVLPVGISFFTFQTMSYSIDIHRRELKPAPSLLDLSVFVSFFPQLVAGPIVRARDFLPQLLKRPSWDAVPVRALLVLFLVGFFKKACVADGLAPFVDRYFAYPEGFDAASSWVAVTSYAIQIYCDFSGYSDMAIACAGLLGYQLGENFAHPYFAASITSFWRRWHISLSTWLRDYLYIPLGGNRHGRFASQRNLLLTMVLGGLWHGAAWNFVIWGSLHGVALMVHKTWSGLVGNRWSTVRAVFGPALTFYWVCVTWIFFRTGSLDLVTRSRSIALMERIETKPIMSANTGAEHQLALLGTVDGLDRSMTVLRSFVTFDSPGLSSLGSERLWLFVGLAILHVIAYRGLMRRIWSRMSDASFTVAYAVAFACAISLVASSKTFIYFQF